MHIDIVPNRDSPPAILLRESYREGAKVRKRTLANLSALSAEQVDAIRRTLKGERLVPVAELFEIVRSRHHGHVQAVRAAIKQLRFESIVASRPSRERDLIVAMVIARILEPASKLATTRWWPVCWQVRGYAQSPWPRLSHVHETAGKRRSTRS